MNCRISDRQKARQNEDVVERYISTTSVADMPKNKNYGTLNRRKILVEILGLSKSARDNTSIKEILDRCDEQLGKLPNTSCGNDSRLGAEERKKFESRILELEQLLKSKCAEIRGVKQEQFVEKWFLNAGRQARR